MSFCLGSWLGINTPIKEDDCRIGLLKVPTFNYDLDSQGFKSKSKRRWKQKEAKEEIYICGKVITKKQKKTHSCKYSSVVRISNVLLWPSTSHLKSSKLLSCYFSVCSVSTSSEAVKRWWVVKNIFCKINHRWPFIISMQCSGGYFFSISSENTERTHRLTANSSVVNLITHHKDEFLT